MTQTQRTQIENPIFSPLVPLFPFSPFHDSLLDFLPHTNHTIPNIVSSIPQFQFQAQNQPCGFQSVQSEHQITSISISSINNQFNSTSIHLPLKNMSERASNGRINTSFSIDLLQRFTGSCNSKGSDPEEDPELNLGLSLGGRFGVDKSKLVRSSSIAAILPVVREGDDDLGFRKGGTGSGDGGCSGLVRTASLPVETEEEWRKRKELQSLRRLAAKRRRSEKQRCLTRVEREEYVAAMGRVGSSVGPVFGSGGWNSGVVDPTTAAASDGSSGGVTAPSVPGSVESQTSSVSEFDSRYLQGSGVERETSPTSIQSTQEQHQQRTNHDTTTTSVRSKPANPTIRPSQPKLDHQANNNNKGKEMGSKKIDMPCVFTQGDGPNGRRIEGILYKYGKGEEVKIMCVCHGSFLTPAEFVKHAGGTDVVHPLKHIVVNPNSSSSYL